MEHPPSQPSQPGHRSDPFPGAGAYAHPPRRRRSPAGELLAWAIILSVTVYITWANNTRAPGPQRGAPVPTAEDHDEVTLRLFSRYLIGADHLMAPYLPNNSIDAAQVRTTLKPYLDDDSPEFDRVRAAIALGELVDAQAALDELDKLEDSAAQQPFIDPHTESDIATLRLIYEGDPGALTASDRNELIKRHDWFGRLALSKDAPDTDPQRATVIAKADRTTITLFAAGVIVLIAGLTGLVLLIIAIILLARGKLRPALSRQLSTVEDPRLAPYAGILACFLVLFLGLEFVAGIIPKVAGINLGHFLLWSVLVAAWWPRLVGTSFHDLRISLGWHTGRGVLREMGAGIVGYLTLLPVAFVGVVLVLILSAVGGFFGLEPHGHPAVERISADPKVMIPLYILGCLWAPIIEETMFRGGFYRYLRGVSHPILAGLIQGFFFAIIHPQGILAVPALMALGFNFAMIREWRGSIIGSMTAHALNNGFVFTMLFIAIG